MEKLVTETSIIEQTLNRLRSEAFFSVNSSQFNMLLEGLLFSAAKYLANTKPEEDATISINDTNGTFIAGVVLEKVKDEDGKDSFEIHFEMDENAVKTEDAILLSDKAVQAFINPSLYEITRNKFIANDITYTFLRLAFAEINNYMNNLSKDDVKDGFTVEFGEYLIVSCDEVDGKHVISIEPGKALKTFVKDDKLVAVE